MGTVEAAAAAQAEQVTESHVMEGELTVVNSQRGDLAQSQAMHAFLEIGKLAGRVQSAQIFGHVADSIQVSQLRQLKAHHKEAGLSWEETCKIVGISRRTAERYLGLADALGDDFFGHCAQIGLSVRTLDAARALPEPVRQALTTGEVVDLEAVSKEALTKVIKDLAREHATAQRTTEEALAKESKARQRAEKKARESAEQVESLQEELEAQKEGLPAEDKKSLEIIRAVELNVCAHLARVKNTLDISGRSPAFIARLQGSLSLIRELAELTGRVIAARADGQEMDEEVYEEAAQGARRDNEDIAHYDQRPSYPGI